MGEAIIGTSSPGMGAVRLVCISESTSLVIFINSWQLLGRFLLRSNCTTPTERGIHVQSISIAQEILPSKNEPLPIPFSVASLGNWLAQHQMTQS